MDKQQIDELRDHYDNTDTSDQMDGGTWETDVDPNPMVTTSLRLPKDVLDWVREQAAEQHAKPTALIRQWIEQRRAFSQGAHRLAIGELAGIQGASELLAAPLPLGGNRTRFHHPTFPSGIEQRLQRLEHAVFDDSDSIVTAPRSPSE